MATPDYKRARTNGLILLIIITFSVASFEYFYNTGYSVGFAYDSSPVKNEHRTFNLTVDEIH